MSKTTEKNGEIARWAAMVGCGYKEEDVVFCEYGHKVHPKHKGIPDYRVDWMADQAVLSLRIECKASNDTRFAFGAISEDQRKWMHDWIELTNRPNQAWLWLQLGDQAVDAVVKNSNRTSTPHPGRRQVYLVAWGVALLIETVMWDCAKLKGIPMNAAAAATRVDTRDGQLHAENLLGQWKLHYQGHGDWWMAMDHPIWSMTGTTPYNYAAALNRRQMVHPE